MLSGTSSFNTIKTINLYRKKGFKCVSRVELGVWNLPGFGPSKIVTFHCKAEKILFWTQIIVETSLTTLKIML